jgi:hypothetical protein
VIVRRYGASPLHALGHAALFALAFWAIANVLDFRGALDWVVWFVGAALLHDLLFLPAYVVLDRVAGGRRPASWINHLRVPAILAGTLLLVWFPNIFDVSPGYFGSVAGHQLTPDALRDWLLVTAVLFAGSVALYVVRSRRAGDHPRGAAAAEHGH